MRVLSIGLMALALSTLAPLAPARAQAPVKIGLITTLSGPLGYLGADLRDGFNLAVKEGGGKLGGVPVKVMVEDDAGKPGNAKQIADRFLQSDHVRIFTGVVFSNITDAILGDVLGAHAYFLGSNTSPDDYAGKNCNPNYFVTGWDESMYRATGVLANELGYKKMFLLAPNYVTGKLAISGFKLTYKGKVVGEAYTGLHQTDYSAEIAQVRAAHPDAIFEFEPGGLGINFLKQYSEAGLAATIPIVAASPALDPRLLAAVGSAARNMKIAAAWNDDFPNAANQAFVAAFRKTYGRAPTPYAAHSYDTALLLASALKASGGKLDDAFRAALRKADFVSIRGDFKFDTNQGPMLDWYELDVVKGPNGKWERKTVRKFLSHARSAYAEECTMK